MTDELQATWNDPSATVYCVFINSTGGIWNGSIFQSPPVDANWSSYAISMPRQGTALKLFYGDEPAALASGTYSYVVFRQDTGGPLVSDTVIATGELIKP